MQTNELQGFSANDQNSLFYAAAAMVIVVVSLPFLAYAWKTLNPLRRKPP